MIMDNGRKQVIKKDKKVLCDICKEKMENLNLCDICTENFNDLIEGIALKGIAIGMLFGTLVGGLFALFLRHNGWI